VELPGVEKDTINLKMHEDSFFLKGETENMVYVGSYAICCPVKPEEAKANYKNGLLKVEVPFKDPMEDAIDIDIQ
jgi:HSP20 family molecular chaperone IbpA